MSIFCILGFYIIIALAEGTVTTLGTIFWLRFQSVSKNNVASKMAPQKKHNPNLVSEQPVATSPVVPPVINESPKGDKENGSKKEEEETKTKKTEDDACGDKPDQKHLTWWKCVLLVILTKFTSTAYLIGMCFVAGFLSSH